MRFIIPFFIFCFFGCTNKRIVHEGDILKKCVITSFRVVEPRSTIEPGYRYRYYTECGEKITVSQKNLYHIGDTITVVYKK